MALWHMHYDSLETVFEVAGLSPLAVAAVVVGCHVPRDVFDATLNALNILAGTHYTIDDIAGVHIISDQADKTSLSVEREIVEGKQIYEHIDI